MRKAYNLFLHLPPRCFSCFAISPSAAWTMFSKQVGFHFFSIFFWDFSNFYGTFRPNNLCYDARMWCRFVDFPSVFYIFFSLFYNFFLSLKSLFLCSLHLFCSANHLSSAIDDLTIIIFIIIIMINDLTIIDIIIKLSFYGFCGDSNIIIMIN